MYQTTEVRENNEIPLLLPLSPIEARISEFGQGRWGVIEYLFRRFLILALIFLHSITEKKRHERSDGYIIPQRNVLKIISGDRKLT
ncbi:hypothetical protein ES703_01590 [subsurface metagenome]